MSWRKRLGCKSHTMERFEFGGEIVWQPTPEYLERSRLKPFLERHGIASFDDLIRRSTQDLEWFWAAVLNELQIEFYQPYSKILDAARGNPCTRPSVHGKSTLAH